MARTKNVIAPEDVKAVVAMDKQQQEIERVEKLYGDGLPFDQFRLETGIKARSASSLLMMIQNGKDYHRLKANLPHGEFIASVERTTGKSRAWANLCMKMADMVATIPQMSTSVDIWNVGQFRAFTLFEKPLIEDYLKGGPLGNIPHDEVATKPRGELEEEARRLRKKVDNQKEAHKKEVEKLNEIIDDLKIRAEDPAHLTKEQKAEKTIEGELEGLRKKLFIEIQQTRFHLGECLKIIDNAQEIEGVTYPMLEIWAKEEYSELAGFVSLLEDLDEALRYVTPDKGEDDGSAA